MVGFELAAHIICDPRLRRGVVVVVVVRVAAAIIALGLLRWSQRRRQTPPPPSSGSRTSLRQRSQLQVHYCFVGLGARRPQHCDSRNEKDFSHILDLFTLLEKT